MSVKVDGHALVLMQGCIDFTLQVPLEKPHPNPYIPGKMTIEMSTSSWIMINGITPR